MFGVRVCGISGHSLRALIIRIGFPKWFQETCRLHRVAYGASVLY